MPGAVYTALRDAAADQHGLVTTGDARRLGIDPQRLIEMRRRGTLEKVGRGLYRFPDFPTDRFEQYMEAVLWPQHVRGVLGHETALDLYELCEVNPAKIHVTLPADYRIRWRAIPAAFAFYRRELSEDEVTQLEGLPVVTVQRAIKDAIEADLRTGLVVQAIDTARERGLLRRAEAEELRAEATAAA